MILFNEREWIKALKRIVWAVNKKRKKCSVYGCYSDLDGIAAVSVLFLF